MNDEPSLYERIHWRIFNLLAKVFAYGLVIVSLIFIVRFSASMFGNSSDISALGLVLFVPGLILGILMAKAKPYYPDKYKMWYERKSERKS